MKNLIISLLFIVLISWFFLIKYNDSKCEYLELKKNSFINEFRLKNPNYLKEKNYVVDWENVNLNQKQIDDELFNIERQNTPLFKCDNKYISSIKNIF